MAEPAPEFNPGIISLNVDDRLLTSHFRDSLFDGGPLNVTGGSLTLTDGFAASLAKKLLDGLEYGFTLGGGASLDIIDDAASIKALAQAMEKLGISVADVLGVTGVSVTLQDTPENIQALLNGPGFELFGKIARIAALPLDADPPPEIEIALNNFDPDIDYAGLGTVSVVGTLNDYEEYPGSLAGAPAAVEFVVLDSLQAYVDAVGEDVNPDTGNLALVANGNFRIGDTIGQLQSADTDLTGSVFDSKYDIYQAVDSKLALDLALEVPVEGDSVVDALGIESLVLVDSIAQLETAAPNLDPADSRIDGVIVVDGFNNLDANPFTDAYLGDTTEVIAEDTAGNLDDELFFPAEDPITFANGKVLTGIIVSTGTLDITIDDILGLELSFLSGTDGELNVSGSIDQLETAESTLADSRSVLDRFEDLNDVSLIGDDSAVSIDAFLSGFGSLEEEFAALIAGFNIQEGTLELNATELSTDALINPLLAYTSTAPFFNPVGSGSLVEIFGEAAVVGDASFAPGTLITPGAGSALIHVIDDAAEIATFAGTLDDVPDDASATIDGFMVDYFHDVSAADIASPLASFKGGFDYYNFESDVFGDGTTVTITGSFDTEWSGIPDIIDISAQTGVTSDEDDNPANDFAFVSSPGDFGDRLSTVFGKPAVDIAITDDGVSALTEINFDGLTAAYNGTTDFTVSLLDVALVGSVDTGDDDTDGDTTDIQNGITVFNFFGIPLLDQIVYSDLDNSALIPDVDLFRFNGVDAYASAAQTYNVLLDKFADDLSNRETEIDTLFNVDGDIIIDDDDGNVLVGDGLDPLNDDVIFGMGGMDEIDGGYGDDFLDGGADDDSLQGYYGDDYLQGGDGNDFLEDKYGTNTLMGGDGNDDIRGGYGIDTIMGGANDDDIYGKYENDVIYGDGGTDYIQGDEGDDTIYGGSEADTIYGGGDKDTIHGDGGDDFIYGGEDEDTIYGGDGNDDINGDWDDDTLYGEYGNDILDGDDGNDTLYGGQDNDTLYGDWGQDLLFGGLGVDSLFGQSGNDHLDGGPGADIIDGGYGIDTVDYSGASVEVAVDLSANSGGNVDDGIDTLTSIESVIGSDYDDTITAASTSFGSVLQGGGGADTLTGGDGQDVFTFMAANEITDDPDTINAFDHPSDQVQIAGNALAGGFVNYGLSGVLLTSQDIFFGFSATNLSSWTSLYSSGGALISTSGYASTNTITVFTSGGVNTLNPAGALSEQQVQLLDLETKVTGESNFGDVFENYLVGLFAPQKIQTQAPILTRFNSTPSGALTLKPTYSAESAFTINTADAHYVAFGMVQSGTGTSLQSALVVAYINNDNAGDRTDATKPFGLNEITASEISAFTVAIFPDLTSDTPLVGDVLLI